MTDKIIDIKDLSDRQLHLLTTHFRWTRLLAVDEMQAYLEYDTAFGSTIDGLSIIGQKQ